MELILKEKDLEEISAIIREFPLKYGIQVLDFLNNKHAIQQQILAEQEKLAEKENVVKDLEDGGIEVKSEKDINLIEQKGL